MKRPHILLLVILGGIGALFLKQTRDLGHTESRLQSELKLLRDAVKGSPVKATAALSGRGSDTLPSTIDAKAFLARLEADPTSEAFGQVMADFAEEYEALIEAAPLSKLKELCGLIEAEYPLDQEKNKAARKVWLAVVGAASKSDPAWAFAKLDRASSLLKAPIGEVLETFKHWCTVNGSSMSSGYAAALHE